MSRDWGSFGGRLRFAATDTLSTNPPTLQTPTMEIWISRAMMLSDFYAASFVWRCIWWCSRSFYAVHKQTRPLPGLLRLYPTGGGEVSMVLNQSVFIFEWFWQQAPLFFTIFEIYENSIMTFLFSCSTLSSRPVHGKVYFCLYCTGKQTPTDRLWISFR